MKRICFALFAPLALTISACSSSEEGEGSSSGGSIVAAVGGASSIGATGAGLGGGTGNATGGFGTGGSVTSGAASGGTAAGGTGGGSAIGGAPAGGGGGAGGSSTVASGGTDSGGTSTGGTITTGGTAGLGGSSETGGAGGAPATGGTFATGGSSETGGSTALGGSAGAAGSSGSGGGEASGGSGDTGGGTGTGGETATWHCATSATVSDSMLEEEYSAWKASFAQTCSNGSAVVKNGGGVVSEGIGYGMLIAAGMQDRELFDALWQFYTDHLDPSGLMNWSMDACADPGDNSANAATDADLDATMALVQADAVWSDGGYLDAASSLGALILEHEVDEGCSGRTVLRPGDAFGGCRDSGSQKINPSYFAPGYYQVFAAKFPDQAATWLALLDDTYELLEICQGRMDGLVPDWSGVDGSDWYSEDYSYDACRTPWRVATHYAWTGDERALTVLQGFTDWVDSNGGLPGAAQQNNSAFLGAFALAACYEQTKFDTYMSGWLTSGGDDTPYFQATLRVVYLLLAGGRFPSTI